MGPHDVRPNFFLRLDLLLLRARVLREAAGGERERVCVCDSGLFLSTQRAAPRFARRRRAASHWQRRGSVSRAPRDAHSQHFTLLSRLATTKRAFCACFFLTVKRLRRKKQFIVCIVLGSPTPTLAWKSGIEILHAARRRRLEKYSAHADAAAAPRPHFARAPLPKRPHKTHTSAINHQSVHLSCCSKRNKKTRPRKHTRQMALSLLRAAMRCHRAPAGSLGLLSHRAFASAALPAVVPPSPSGDDALDEFRETVREFASSVVAPHAESIDRNNSFPTDVNLWTAMGEFGLLGELGVDGAAAPHVWRAPLSHAHNTHPHPHQASPRPRSTAASAWATPRTASRWRCGW